MMDQYSPKEQLTSNPAEMLSGHADIPGDKSISQRAAIMAALAEGVTTINGYLQADDADHTLGVLESLGARLNRENGKIIVEGVGAQGFSDPAHPLYFGNSGTGLRLMLGALSGQRCFAVCTGDDSLSQRPMGRVTEPLVRMGAAIEGRNDGSLLPISVKGGGLSGTSHKLSVASAQVKSALLLAGLGAQGVTQVTEPALSRDHTERMLPLFGVNPSISGLSVSVEGPTNLVGAGEISIPRDPSSAAFIAVGAMIVPGSEVTMDGVSLNPTRTGWIDVLRLMGGQIEVEETGRMGREPVGRITVSASNLNGCVIEGDMIPRTIDELPIICVAAALADGVTTIRDAHELRVKETDRLDAIRAEWENIGIRVKEYRDGLDIEGRQRIKGGRADGRGDHRIAMSLAIAGLVADRPVKVQGAECIRISFPHFHDILNSLGAKMRWQNGN